MVIWILIFVGLALAPSCSSSSMPNNTHYYKTPPTAQSPSPSHSSPPYYPILAKGKKRPPPTPPPPPPAPLVTPFDYFKLAETWPTSFCLVENCVNPPPSPVVGPSQSLPLSDFRKFWPNLLMVKKTDEYELWINQWKHHGTCSSMYAKDFYKLAFQIYLKKDLKAILLMNGITPGGKEQESQKIFDAIKSGIGGFNPEIECKMHQNKSYLVEIRLCLDKKDVVYTNCGPDPRLLKIQCPDKVYFP
ncbi:S6 RNase [Trifolium pratense]|uniref:S6 RNase n=1 Tax=Trifolium pratense TaxID=57577 RepID=A0A2K3LLL0_TRIPR|nr:S6 RNase [Trifolium pratense]